MNRILLERVERDKEEGRSPLSGNAASTALPVGKAVSSISTTAMIALLLALALVWFGTLDYRKLISSDEGRYAEIAREMVVTGDWLTPRYNGVKYFEKPVLLYWTTAAAFTVFGQHEWTARLWVALTGFAGVVLLFFTGKAIFGRTAGLLSAAVLSSSALWVGAGHMNTTDMGVSFFLEGALCAFLLAFRPGVSPKQSRALMYACWAAMGLAVLSKGLIGIVLPVSVLAAYVAASRDLGIVARLQLRKGLMIFLVITVPWFLMVSVRNPEFPAFFFIHEHLGRFTMVDGYNRAGPWWYFGAIIAVGLLPWTFAIFGALRPVSKRELTQKRANQFNPTLLLWIWLAVILVFFSVSSSKLPGYILPVFPTLALLIGHAFTHMARRELQVFLGGTLVLTALAFIGSNYIPLAAPNATSISVYRAYETRIQAGIGLVFAGATSAFLLISRSKADRKEPVRALVVFAVCSHLAIQTIILGHDLLRARSSAYDLAQRIDRRIDRTQPFYAVRTFDHTLPFYMKKTMTLVESQDELAFGLSIEPKLWINSISDFERRWQEDRRPMALMQANTYDQLKRQGLPMRIVAQDEKRIVVEKP